MDSAATVQVPVIYFSDQNIKPGSEKWVEVRKDVRKALEEYGCFEAACDKVSKELHDSVIESMEELFSLPVEIKKRNVCPKPFVGYLTHNNLSESLGVQEANILEKAEEFTRQIWPEEGNKKVSEAIQKFAEKLAEIDVMVRKMLMESFGIEKYIDEHLNSTNYRIRLMKYVAPPEPKVDADAPVGNVDVKVNNADVGDGVNANASVNVSDDVNANANASVNGDAAASGDVDAVTSALDGVNLKDDVDANGNTNVSVNADANGKTNVGVSVNADANDKTGGDGEKVKDTTDDVEAKLGLPCHTDKNLLTVIFQHEVEGLEVITKDGKWIRIKPSPTSFVVVAGDCLCALTNGRIAPCYHRVRVTEKKRTRYSVGLFTQPKPGLLVNSPEELVDEEHPRAFRPFDYSDLMGFYHTEVGKRAPSTLQAYCAISTA